MRDISEVTGFPEMLDGRVKTLHPRIHGGILGIRDNPEHVATMQAHGIEPIDLVVCNLYPFEATVARAGATHEEIVENIDIGGPSMVRSAAKNYRDVAVVTDSGPVRRRAGRVETKQRRPDAGDTRASGRRGVRSHRRLRSRHQRATSPASAGAEILPATLDVHLRAPSDAALWREPAPAGRFLRRAVRSGRLHRPGRGAARQGTIFQQPARSR